LPVAACDPQCTGTCVQHGQGRCDTACTANYDLEDYYDFFSTYECLPRGGMYSFFNNPISIDGFMMHIHMKERDIFGCFSHETQIRDRLPKYLSRPVL